jgi:hypothetical protein
MNRKRGRRLVITLLVAAGAAAGLWAAGRFLKDRITYTDHAVDVEIIRPSA